MPATQKVEKAEQGDKVDKLTPMMEKMMVMQAESATALGTKIDTSVAKLQEEFKSEIAAQVAPLQAKQQEFMEELTLLKQQNENLNTRLSAVEVTEAEAMDVSHDGAASESSGPTVQRVKKQRVAAESLVGAPPPTSPAASAWPTTTPPPTTTTTTTSAKGGYNPKRVWVKGYPRQVSPAEHEKVWGEIKTKLTLELLAGVKPLTLRPGFKFAIDFPNDEQTKKALRYMKDNLPDLAWEDSRAPGSSHPLRFVPDRSQKDNKVLGMYSALKSSLEKHIASQDCPVGNELVKRVVTSGATGSLFVELTDGDTWESYTIYLKDVAAEPTFKLCPQAAQKFGISIDKDAAFRASALKAVSRE